MKNRLIRALITVYCVAVSIPNDPLATDGPALKHLGAQRPRPKRNHRHRPAGVQRRAGNEPVSVWDAPPPSTDEPDYVAPLEENKLVANNFKVQTVSTAHV